ncbi:ladderlectin-like isoform 2-T3 [Pholidichthys leucotaenia]
MKLLIISGLLCAVMALITAAALPEEDSMDETEAANEKDHDIVKRSKRSCPCGWKQYYGRCYLYVPKRMTWRNAQAHCASMNANLASVRCTKEYNFVRQLTRNAARYDQLCWIGGTDAKKEGAWKWSDGSRFTYGKWCWNEPNNYRRRKDCLQMNFKKSGRKCWNAAFCGLSYPSVCTKTIS